MKNNGSQRRASLRTKFSLILAATLALSLIPSVAGTPPEAEAATPSFALGADLGWLKQLEDQGNRWVNDSGVVTDPLQLLKDKGINSVRLRVFVNPSSDSYWLKDGRTLTMLGYTDAPRVLAAAQRATAMGMSIMLDFHYSDVFADPGHQIKPAAWNNYTDAQMQTAVYNHTFDVMTLMKNNGITPAWVQVGNEINPGILLPNGSTSNWPKLTALLNKGYDAVKAVSPVSKVITHTAFGVDVAAHRSWYDSFFANGGKTDIIGNSFYPYWMGKPYWELTAPLGTVMNDLAARYNKEVMIVEVGGLETNPTDSFWTIRGAIDAMKAVPNGKGIGVFYWEPDASSTNVPDAYNLGSSTRVSDKMYRFTSAMDAFWSATPPAPVTNLITNPGFESDANTQNPSGWSTWSNGNEAANYTESGGVLSSAHRLTHWKTSAYQVSTYQIKTGIANGTYTLKAWVKGSGGFTTNTMYVKNYGSAEKNIQIPTTSTWTQITITNIQVSNGSAQIGFWTVQNTPSNNWMSVDNVEFVKN